MTAAAAAESGEIVVTARRREERLFDVAAPVSAVTGKQIEDLRLQDARDVLMLVPGAYLQEGVAGSARDYSIRGVGTPSLFTEAGVAGYVDDVYTSSYVNHPTQFYDVDRIEVLRGPQGALYGRNAVGGAVNVISRRPTDRFEGRVRGTLARYDRYEAEATVNLPLTDQAAIRATGWWVDQSEGEYFNPTLGRFIDTEETLGGRLVASWRPTPELNLTLIGELTDARVQGTAVFFPTGGESERNVPRDTQPINDLGSARLTLTTTYSSTVGDFTLIGSWREYELDGVEDTDLTANAGLASQRVLIRTNRVESRYAELRWVSPDWSPVSLIAGLVYLDDTGVGRILSQRPAQLDGGVPASLAIDNDQSVESIAGYAEAAIDLTPRLTLTGSARYTRDRKTVDFDFLPSPALRGVFGQPQQRAIARTFTDWSPGGSIEWRPSDDAKLYGRIQTGFRAGGFNFNVASVTNLPYDAEESINYEIGGKIRFAQRRATAGLTLFQLDQRDVLVPQFDFTAAPTLQGFLANVGEARTRGLEFEMTFAPVPGVSLGGTLGLIDAEFTEGTTFGASIVGKELPSSRPLTYSIYGQIDLPLTDEVDIVYNASFAHRARGFAETSNITRMSASDVLNISAGFDYARFRLVVFAQNLFDDRYDLAFGGFRPPATFGVVRAPGLRYGLTLSRDF